MRRSASNPSRHSVVEQSAVAKRSQRPQPSSKKSVTSVITAEFYCKHSVRTLAPGSIALGLLLSGLGLVCLVVLGRSAASVSRIVGVAIAVAALAIVLSYDNDGTFLGLGSKTTTACLVAALGIAMATSSRVPAHNPDKHSDR